MQSVSMGLLVDILKSLLVECSSCIVPLPQCDAHMVNCMIRSTV